MISGLSYWFKSLGLMALLGASLGGMGSYWYFFWENREMCPCAPAGIEGGEGLSSEVVQPYSEILMQKRVIKYSLGGGLLGLALGLFIAAPQAKRMNKAMKEISSYEDEHKNE